MEDSKDFACGAMGFVIGLNTCLRFLQLVHQASVFSNTSFF